MGAKASTAGNGERDETRERTFSSSSTEGGGGGGGFDVLRAGVGPGERGRSFSTPGVAHGQQPFESQETDSSSTEAESPISAAFPRVYPTHALPSHIFSWNGIKCPVCSKFVLPDDIECHLVMCLTKPRLIYNEDILTEDKGECVICLEDLSAGNTIARLPCLCIYHKSCIDRWFDVNRSCPEHPGD